MMNAQTMLKGAFLTFCLTGVLVLPAAAAGTVQAPGIRPARPAGKQRDRDS